MSIISSIKTFVNTYSGLEANRPVWVDHLGPNPVEYAIVPLAGGKIVEEYISGGSVREYFFAFQAAFFTSAEAERLENSGFFEAIGEWFEAQTWADDLPTMDSGKTATKIEALGFGYIYEQGQSETGIYQVQCRLEYEQEAP